MKVKIIILFLIFNIQNLLSQNLEALVPSNTATHIAVNDGSWFNIDTWNTKTIPGNAAIVHIPKAIKVTYEGESNAHIFIIRVDGEFICTQVKANEITTLKVDTFIGTHMSYVKFIANKPTDGRIDVTFTPFDIEKHKNGTSGYSLIWNQYAKNHFSDYKTTYKVTKSVGPEDRFNSYAEAILGNTKVTISPKVAISDGPGVLGRHAWDEEQVSLGIVLMGQTEIIGKEKKNMIKLSEDALKNQKTVFLKEALTNWKVGDKILITRGGNKNAASNGDDVATIASINNNKITVSKNLEYNHKGRPTDDLHCYVGNLTRNITFKSSDISQISRRGHSMAMHNDKNVQIKNAAFLDMGRTDKSILLDDFIWDKWLQPKVFTSKISALGQECAEMKKNPKNEITNTRGRYSIHLHKTGAQFGAKITKVTGNVVWGNPGWGITHHDSHADVSNNIVYDVVGAGIVSETGSETGIWDHNLVVNIKKGHNIDTYTAALFHDDYLYSGQGLGMKGRAVLCKNNVIVNANQGVGVINMNPSINNLDRVDAKALATTRVDYEVDNFPLSVNGYSIEGDGVMPVEASLIMENTTIIDCYQGLRSIERDMGVNHESRSVFDGFIAWGVSQGLSITYQADYSFKDIFISGRNNNSIGAFLWKHSHNHTFENIKMVDLGFGITVSKLVESGNGKLKTRNNGFTPWYFVNLKTENVASFYQIIKEDENTATSYTEHSDNSIHLKTSEVKERPTTFTVLDSTKMKVNYAANNFRFEVDGIITDDFGSYKMGIEQAPAQGTLRLDYPSRIYEFASKAKFEEYVTNKGIYKDKNGDYYFILNESLPNRRTFKYTSFPVRIKIENPGNGGVFANAQTESDADLSSKYQIISRFATVTQSSTRSAINYNGATIIPSANKAIDGNNNGRKNAQIYQQNLVPIGSFSQTKTEIDPWFDLDLGEQKIIDYIDIWNTVELNGADIEKVSTHFKNFSVLISNVPFTDTSLENSRKVAKYEYLKNGIPTRKFSLEKLNIIGRYVRIQAEGNTKIKLAEVEIIGKKTDKTLSTIKVETYKTEIYPNPTSSILNINLNKNYKSTSLIIFNVLGKKVYSERFINKDKIKTYLSFKPGVYFVKIITDNKNIFTKKILKL